MLNTLAPGAVGAEDLTPEELPFLRFEAEAQELFSVTDSLLAVGLELVWMMAVIDLAGPQRTAQYVAIGATLAGNPRRRGPARRGAADPRLRRPRRVSRRGDPDALGRVARRSGAAHSHPRARLHALSRTTPGTSARQISTRRGWRPPCWRPGSPAAGCPFIAREVYRQEWTGLGGAPGRSGRARVPRSAGLDSPGGAQGPGRGGGPRCASTSTLGSAPTGLPDRAPRPAPRRPEAREVASAANRPDRSGVSSVLSVTRARLTLWRTEQGLMVLHGGRA